ncbi:MAG: hypothetical protein HAW62_01415 [Endozoicomonadaceae bacterium]|nr:hypothetical protein [Endozoicomonadaceae bacterium]
MKKPLIWLSSIIVVSLAVANADSLTQNRISLESMQEIIASKNVDTFQNNLSYKTILVNVLEVKESPDAMSWYIIGSQIQNNSFSDIVIQDNSISNADQKLVYIVQRKNNFPPIIQNQQYYFTLSSLVSVGPVWYQSEIMQDVFSYNNKQIDPNIINFVETLAEVIPSEETAVAVIPADEAPAK